MNRAALGPGGRRPIVLVFALLAACSAQTTPGTSPSGGSSPPASVGPPSVEVSPSGPVQGAPTTLRLKPSAAGSFLVRGRYPHVASRCRDPEPLTLAGRFPGTLLVRRADDGTLALTVTLPFERYLEGIAEVPPSWPAAALEAQAIAARSYALATTGWAGEQGEPLAEPICATTACQVYRGIPVPREPLHRRWVGAVRRTAGEILLHDGRPATTVYFSTSNGRTYGNDEIFGSAPLPYLRPVTERDDGASSTSRWRVRIPFDDLTRFLRAAGMWPRGRAISVARPRAGALIVRGDAGRRSIDLGDLRDAVNVWAPCLEPDRFPPVGPSGALPLTIPSRWLQVAASRHAVVVTGRGWGHGVGMVQWGAYGKARRGLSAGDILAYYYGGLRPQTHPEPGLIHVEVASGLSWLRIAPSDSDAQLNGRPIRHDRIVISGGDRLEVRTETRT